jgi:hypothetical protein
MEIVAPASPFIENAHHRLPHVANSTAWNGNCREGERFGTVRRQMSRALIVIAGAVSVCGVGCSSEGSVTFAIREPADPRLDPLTAQVSELLVKSAAGDVIGVATLRTGAADGGVGAQRLALGPLKVTATPIDVEVDLLDGSDLVGMARVRDVSIRNGAIATYYADVRKPLILVGNALPDEPNRDNQLLGGEILDPTTSLDLANPRDPPGPNDPPPPRLPADAGALAATSDGRFGLAGRKNAIGVFDTGSGREAGDAALPFTPTLLAVAPRDTAAVALGSDGTNGLLALFDDVVSLTGTPTAVTPHLSSLAGQIPRAVTYSADGRRIFVLTGGTSADPCAPGALLAPNAIVAVGLDGATQATWSLPGFVSDVALDAATGLLVLSEAKQVSLFSPDGPSGAATTRKLFAANCPSALHVAGGEVFVVSSDRSTNNEFQFHRAQLATGADHAISFTGPLYEGTTDDPSMDNNVRFNIQLRPASIMAYALAVTPDGRRAEFATRARYHELRQPLQLLGTACTATVDIIEYGLYALDTGTGNTSYELRSQLVTMPPAMGVCITCPTSVGDIGFGCPSLGGDRAAGIVALFGGT